jgi:hypothetical protein
MVNDNLGMSFAQLNFTIYCVQGKPDLYPARAISFTIQLPHYFKSREAGYTIAH